MVLSRSARGRLPVPTLPRGRGWPGRRGGLSARDSFGEQKVSRSWERPRRCPAPWSFLLQREAFILLLQLKLWTNWFILPAISTLGSSVTCWRASVPCCKGHGFICHQTIDVSSVFSPQSPVLVTFFEEFCNGTPQMSKDCKNKILVLVYIDFLPSKYTSGCESCGLSQ